MNKTPRPIQHLEQIIETLRNAGMTVTVKQDENVYSVSAEGGSRVIFRTHIHVFAIRSPYTGRWQKCDMTIRQPMSKAIVRKTYREQRNAAWIYATRDDRMVEVTP
jgi:hypothetical protein